AGDLGSLTEHVLRGSGFVIDVAGVDVGAMREKKLGDVGGAGKMEGCLAVAAAGMNQGGSCRCELAQDLEQTEARRRVGVDARPAFDGIFRQVWFCVVQEPETAGPPLAAGVDVGTGREERIE